MTDYVVFREAKKRYIAAIGAEPPYSYAQWLALPDKHKAIALYVNFYDQVTLAWTKAKAEFVDDEDAVSIVLQYLMTNVPLIVNDPKKYKESYIYRVAYNCMGCLRRVQSEQSRYANTVPQYKSVGIDNEEVDIFDTIADTNCPKLHAIADLLFSVYDDLDSDTKKVIRCIIENKAITGRAKTKEAEIYHQLRKIFANYADDFLVPKLICDNFADVLKYDSLIESATVMMRDGVKATYYGEKRVASNGKTEVVFFGPTQDYVIPVSIAYDLEVVEVEMYNT